MKRLFWLGLGVAAGVAVTRKATGAVKQLTPAGIAANLGDAVRELAGAIGAFGAEVHAGMVEREEELRDVVEHRTGISPGRRPTDAKHSGGSLDYQPPSQRSETRSGARRARRAGG